MVITPRRGVVAMIAITAGIGFAALILWVSTPLDLAAHSQPAPSQARVLAQVSTGAREVALTFDDGPEPKNTRAILALLQQYHAQATFFVLGGQAQHYPGLVETIARDGEEVESHGMSHRSLTGLRPAAVSRELVATAGLLHELTGVDPRFFRPPYGNYDQSVLAAAARLRETVTLWTIDTRDWTGRSTAAIVSTVMTQLRPGAIILLHDGGGPRGNTVRAVRAILLALSQRGYRAVTLQQLVRDAQPRSERTAVR